MPGPKVDIAIACAPNQEARWWNPLACNIARWVRMGIEVAQLITPGSAMTDVNRCKVVADSFLPGDAEWLFWQDDDVGVPLSALPVLLSLNRPFCAGLVTYKDDDAKPMAYKRMGSGIYAPIENWERGELIEVDGIHMGCTLIHRSVYEDVMKEHTVFVRSNGSLFPIHNDKVLTKKLPRRARDAVGQVLDGYHVQKLEPWEPKESDRRRWPFYCFEHNRTEDLWFCELAANVGHTPLLDTKIECSHQGYGEWSGINYRRSMLARWREEAEQDVVGTLSIRE